MKLVSVLFILFTFPAFAQEKGAYFRLGQTILATSGNSYSNIEDNIYANEVAATACSNKLRKLAFQEADRDKDIKDCNENSKRVFLKPDNTGFDLKDFLMIGCNGTIEKEVTRESYRTNKPETQSLKLKFETRMNSGEIIFQNLDLPADNYDGRIHIQLPPQHEIDFVTLSRTYEKDFPKTSSSPNGNWKYKYKLSENSERKIELEYEYEAPIDRGREKASLKCISKTLDEMNAMAKLYE